MLSSSILSIFSILSVATLVVATPIYRLWSSWKFQKSHSFCLLSITIFIPNGVAVYKYI